MTNRVNNLITQNNPTEGNSELIDIRLGAGGETYKTAGEAVRKQVGSVSNKITEISNHLGNSFVGLADTKVANKFVKSETLTNCYFLNHNPESTKNPQIRWYMRYTGFSKVAVSMKGYSNIPYTIDLNISFNDSNKQTIGNSNGYKVDNIKEAQSTNISFEYLTIDLTSSMFSNVDFSLVYEIVIYILVKTNDVSADTDKYIQFNLFNLFYTGILMSVQEIKTEILPLKTDVETLKTESVENSSYLYGLCKLKDYNVATTSNTAVVTKSQDYIHITNFSTNTNPQINKKFNKNLFPEDKALISIALDTNLTCDVTLIIAFYDEKNQAIGNANGYKVKVISSGTNPGKAEFNQGYDLKSVLASEGDYSKVAFVYTALIIQTRGNNSITTDMYLKLNKFVVSTPKYVSYIPSMPLDEAAEYTFGKLHDKLLLSCVKEPKKIVTWIDDDTPKAGITQVKAICDELGIKCTFACVTNKLSDEDLLAQLLQYQSEGYHITSHTNVHTTWYRADGDNPILSLQQVEEDLIKSLQILKSHNFLDSDCLVYPGSSPAREGIHEIVKKWCRCGVLAGGSVNVNYSKGKYDINRTFINKSSQLSYYTNLIANVDSTKDNWMVWGTHSGISTEFDATLVKSVLQYCLDNGWEFMTLNEALKYREKLYIIQELFGK